MGQVQLLGKLIITYNDASTGKHDVLSSFRRDEITQLDWTDTKYMAKPLDSFTNVGKHFYHMMDTKMPTNISYLNENLVTMLENAVILNIDSVMSEDVEHSNSMSYLSEDLGSNAVVATFWGSTSSVRMLSSTASVCSKLSL